MPENSLLEKVLDGIYTSGRFICKSTKNAAIWMRRSYFYAVCDHELISKGEIKVKWPCNVCYTSEWDHATFTTRKREYFTLRRMFMFNVVIKFLKFVHGNVQAIFTIQFCLSLTFDLAKRAFFYRCKWRANYIESKTTLGKKTVTNNILQLRQSKINIDSWNFEPIVANANMI